MVVPLDHHQLLKAGGNRSTFWTQNPTYPDPDLTRASVPTYRQEGVVFGACKVDRRLPMTQCVRRKRPALCRAGRF